MPFVGQLRLTREAPSGGARVTLARRLLYRRAGVRDLGRGRRGKRLETCAAVVALVAVIALAGLVVPTGHVRTPQGPIWFGGWLVAAFVLGQVSRGQRSPQLLRRAG